MEARRDESSRRRAGWSSPSLDRYHRRRRGRSPDDFRRRDDDRWSRQRRWRSREDDAPRMMRRDRSRSWSDNNRHRRRHFRSRSRSRHYSPPSRRRRRSPSPYDYQRERSKSPYSPTRKRRRRSDSREYDRLYHRSDRHRDEATFYRHDDATRQRRPERRRSSDDAPDRPRRRRRRRRDRSPSVSPSTRSRSGNDRVAAASPPRAGVVSDDELEGTHKMQPAPVKERKEPLKKRSDSTLSASSSKDDTVGHFRGGPGTVIVNRYRITRDVGMGTFGRVVECLDQKKRKPRSRGKRSSRDNEHRRETRVAIKIVRNVKRYYDSALIEADIVKDVNRRGGRGTSHCAVLHNAFTFSGHFCLVFENLGPSLYDFLKRHSYQPFPMVCVRPICRQLLETLEFLHSFRLIHTDLKPENILLTNYRERSYKLRGRTYQIPESTDIKVIDFGGATYDDEKKSSVVNTRQYRAPEVILGLGWSTPSDLWSAGCILAELYMGELLFATHDNIEHLALMEQAIGPFSRRMLKHAKNSPIAQRAFDSSGRHLVDGVLVHESASFVKNMLPLESIIREEDGRFLDLLRRLLVIDPGERAPASEVVQCRL